MLVLATNGHVYTYTCIDMQLRLAVVMYTWDTNNMRFPLQVIATSQYAWSPAMHTRVTNVWGYIIIVMRMNGNTIEYTMAYVASDDSITI